MLATEEQTAPRTREEKDLDEWNTLITALEAYKQEHGDLRVPTRYTVPVSYTHLTLPTTPYV